MNMIDTTSQMTNDASVTLLKALASLARQKILVLLRNGEHCVCHLEAHLGYRQAYLSQQLRVLKDAGLIEDRREGWNVYYRVLDPKIFDVLDQVLALSGQAPIEIETPKEGCPCPQCNAKKCCSN